MTTALITQSNYIPWRCYFAAIDRADVLVRHDVVQYTRRDWRNRNKIRTAQGLKWLTIPVQVKGRYRQSIDETRVAGHEWADRHWETIRHEYARARCFDSFREFFAQLYKEAAELELLTDINHLFLRRICDLLAIDTEFRHSREFELDPTLDASTRLLRICEALGVDRYLTGPAARPYLDVSALEAVGISVEWLDYSGYPEYTQLHEPFEAAVSIVDMILNEGDRATELMRKVGLDA